MTSKHTAAFLAAIITCSTAFGHCPTGRQKAGTKTPSVRDFAESILTQLPEQPDTAFESLCYNKNDRTLMRDGEAVSGDNFSGFRVIDGELCIAASKTVRAGETAEQGYLTLEEAAPLIGLETHETEKDIYVSEPFQSGTLIVKSEELSDTKGAYEIGTGWNDLHVLQYQTAADAYAAYQDYQKDDSVIYAEPNRVFHIDDAAVTNGSSAAYPFPSENWGWASVGADSFLTKFEESGISAPEVTVAVVDTGLYSEHTWFQGRIAEGGTSFIADNSPGFEDVHGHGTHCAGIICGMTPDNVKILPLRVLNSQGIGDSLGIYCAMLYAAEQDADVVSMSLGGTGCSPLLEEAIRILKEKKIPCVVAAGNEAQDAKYHCPANTPDAITISSVTHLSQPLMKDTGPKGDIDYWLSFYSNTGEGIDFAAPGEFIDSAFTYSPDSTEILSGTSMACPHAAGCVADILTLQNDLTVDEIYECLKANARDIGPLGFDDSFGWGMVNISNLDFHCSPLAKPESSCRSGRFEKVFTVKLSTPEPDAEIRYTVDGTIPEADTGILYQGEEITIDKTTDLYAVTVKDGERSSCAKWKYEIYKDAPVLEAVENDSDSSLQIRIQDTWGGIAFYTLDGSDPGPDNGIMYTKPFTITESTLVKAAYVIGQFVSEPTVNYYVIDGKISDQMFETQDGVLTHCYTVFGKTYSHDNILDLNDYFAPGEITAIGDYAFQGRESLYGIILPESVSSIGAYAFESCTLLESVQAPGVEYVGPHCFEDNNYLTEIEMPALKKIEPYAFYAALNSDNEMPFDADNQIEEIGDHAFESSCLVRAEFPKLKTLGKSVFSYCYSLKTIKLPPVITELPEETFYGCNDLITLDAPGVTVLDDRALYAFDSSPIYLKTCTIDFSKLTSIGSEALTIFDRPDPMHAVSFDSLTHIKSNAFSQFPADKLYLPALKEIPAYAFWNANCSTVYLEQAETLEYGALTPNPDSVHHITYLFGSHVSKHQKNPLEDGCTDVTVAAPADSQMITFAKAKNYENYCTPDFCIPSGTGSVRQYDIVSLNTCCIPLALDANVRFTAAEAEYESGYDAPESPIFPDASGEDMLLDTSVPGTVTVQAELMNDAGSVLTSKTIQFTIEPADETDYTTKEGVFCFDWQNQTIRRSRWIDAFTATEAYGRYTFSFVPEEAGEYFFIPEDERIGISIFSTDNKLLGTTENQPMLDVNLAADPVKLEAGESVRIVAETTSDSFLEYRYTGILITQKLPYRLINTYDYHFEAKLDQNVFRKGTGTPDISSLSVIDAYDDYDYETGSFIPKELEKNVDYQLQYVQNGDIGTILVFGIGAFRGVLRAPVYFYEEYTPGETVDLPETKPGETLLYHVSNLGHKGKYLIGVDYSKHFLEEYAAGRTTENIYDNIGRITLLNSDMEIVDREGSSIYVSAEEIYSMGAEDDYYIQITFTSNEYDTQISPVPEGMFALSVKTYEENRWLPNCEAVLPETIRYSGSSLKLVQSVTAQNGDLLEEGKDYLVYYANDIIPGTARVVIRGIGDYYGIITLNTEITPPDIEEGPFAPETMHLNEPFLLSANSGCFDLELSSSYRCCLHRTGSAEPDASFISTIMQYDPEFFSWIPVSTKGRGAESPVTELEAGFYRIYISQDTQDQSYILEAEETIPGISKAEVQSEMLYYTGEELKPALTLTLGGKTLTEGTDYVLMYAAQPIIECGTYVLTVTGIGAFCGERTVPVTVIEQEKTALPEAIYGENTLPVTEPGQTASLIFTPDKTSCAVSIDPLFPAELTVYDTETNTVAAQLNGNGYLYTFFDVIPGREYMICASYLNSGQTGEIGMTLLTDYTDLTACTVEAPAQIMFADQLTDFTVKNGDTVLQQDTDYRICYNGAKYEPGHAVLSLIGTGNCIGELQYQYYLAPDPDTEQSEDPQELALNTATEPFIPMPGDMQQFVFEAPADGQYSISRPDPAYSGVCVFAYGPDTALLPLDAAAADLKKGEKLRFIAVADHIEDRLNTDGTYTLAVYSGAPDRALRIGDSVYLIRNGAAYLDQYEGENIGIQLPETVYDPEQDLDIPVKGYTPELIAALAPTRTFYCEQDSESYAYMQETGVCFAVPDPQTDIRGDITGDGVVNANDWLTLMRWLNENPGMLMHDSAYTAADMNEDGCLDLLDANAIAELAAAEQP